MLGETVGSYRITGKLSEGGMGVVYRAEHALLGRAAAIKLILPVWSENREIVDRFFNEAKVTSSIRHPGIVEIFDFGYHADGRAYLVMELLPGEPLSRRLAHGRLDELVAVLFARSIAGALAAAHARGVVHRDLKPDNVFLVPDPDVPGGERPKILDFGIAKLADRRASKTATGAVMGTPAYMSPEQCRGAGVVDARADLYSLGCMLYEMVAGRAPFVAEGAGELIGAHLFLAPDPLRAHAPAVSGRLEALVARLLEKEPARRPQTATEVAGELAAIAGEAPGPAAWKVVAPTPMPATIVATPTTLGGSAGATPTHAPAVTAKRSKRGVWVAIAGMVLAGGAAAAAVKGLGGGGAGGEHEAPARAAVGTEIDAMPAQAQAQPQPQPQPQPQAQPQPQPQPLPQPQAQPQPQPVPQPVPQPQPPPQPPPPPPQPPPQVASAHGKKRHPPQKTAPSTPPATQSTTPTGPLVDDLPPPTGPLVNDLPAPTK